MKALTPLILDFDGAVSDISDAVHLPLQAWQETIRFGCRWRQFHALEKALDTRMPDEHGCVFTGSGDYHHLSHLLLKRLPTQQKFQLIICDNHPDNMRYPFGIHCGSWVYWASRLPQVEHVHVLGIGSQDIGLGHAWENHWSPLLKGKLTYWNVNVDTRWMNWVGCGRGNRAFSHADALMSAFLAQFDRALPVYLSIDKDVLSPDVVNTNWDQGEFLEHHLAALIEVCQGRIIGADITGDVSEYHYQSAFKRWLSASDGQVALPPDQVRIWQQQQNALNARLVRQIHQGWAAR
ncbi:MULTISPECIES: hypothetical protein [Pseudomonas]|uniref:hypothetical protein n=1 Tax=Pseudomonas TaxID=286 RepID=UPI001AE644A1|nr:MULTISPECIES: hypothetical protein [unclassified Pseudomonas]MBP1126697.1 hypothetical protein [Pseudomonas sp. PvP025]MDQ0400557.1 hypothetical protein [Pseudomonas sp. PvP006]